MDITTEDVDGVDSTIIKVDHVVDEDTVGITTTHTHTMTDSTTKNHNNTMDNNNDNRTIMRNRHAIDAVNPDICKEDAALFWTTRSGV